MKRQERPYDTKKDSRSGFTLVELIVLIALITVLVLKASEAYSDGERAQSKLAVRELLSERVRTAMERVANRLRQAGADTVMDVPPFPETSSLIRFRQLASYDPKRGPVWGAEETIFRRVDPAGNGALVWTDGTTPFPWCIGVSDLEFFRQGRRIIFEIEAVATCPDGDRISVRRQCNVAMQN